MNAPRTAEVAAKHPTEYAGAEHSVQNGTLERRRGREVRVEVERVVVAGYVGKLANVVLRKLVAVVECITNLHSDGQGTYLFVCVVRSVPISVA